MARSSLTAPEGRANRRVTALKATLSLLLLGYALSLVPVEDLASIARRVNWWPVAASVAAMLIVGYLNAFRMYLLTSHQEMTLRPRELMAINLITTFYGLFTPGYIAGGAIRWYYMSRADGKRAQALAAIVFNRVLETALLISLGVVFWLVESREGEREGYGLILALAVLMSAVVYIVVMSRQAHRALRWLIRLARTPKWFVERFEKVQSALETYSDRRWSFHANVLGVAILHHAFGFASLILLAHAASIEVGPATLGWIRSALALALMLPISVGGFGVRELTLVTLLAPYGVSPAAALMLALLILSRELVTGAIGGLLVLARVLVPPRDTRFDP